MGRAHTRRKTTQKRSKTTKKLPKPLPKPKNPTYFIGLSKWQNKDTEGAIASLAKVVVLKKALAPKAQEQLEKLYKPLHNDSLDGLDQVLAKAKSELGIS